MSEPLLGKIWDLPETTLHQKAFLWNIIYNPKITCTQLAKKISCKRRSLPDIADSLIERGWLSNVKTKKRGRNNYTPLKDILNKVWEDRYSPAKKEEIVHVETEQAHNLINEIQDNFSESHVVPSPAPCGPFTGTCVVPSPAHLIDNNTYNTSTVIFDKNLEEELIELSDKKADINAIQTLTEKYKTPHKHLVNAINILKPFGLAKGEYNKYLNVATYKLHKENLSEQEVKEIIAKRIAKNAKTEAAASSNQWEVDELIMYGLNYNNNFNQPYSISKRYAYAAEALTKAGVNFEIR